MGESDAFKCASRFDLRYMILHILLSLSAVYLGPCRAFDFDADERWLQYFSSVEVPHGDKAAITERLKLKWYKKNVVSCPRLVHYHIALVSPSGVSAILPHFVHLDQRPHSDSPHSDSLLVK